MSKVQQALSQLIADLDAGIAPKPVRRTTLTPREDDSILRRVLADDGSVVAEEIVTPGQSVTLAARAKTGLSQTRFAALLGISVRTLHDWEQGRRTPSGPAKTLLAIALAHPEILRDIAAP